MSSFVAKLNLGPVNVQFFPAAHRETNQTIPSIVVRAKDQVANHDMSLDDLSKLITDLNILRAQIQATKEGV